MTAHDKQQTPSPSSHGSGSDLVQRLANSLAVFTKHYEPWMDLWQDDSQTSTFSRHTFGELRHARKLIEEADNAFASLPEPLLMGSEPTHRHKKRGSMYMLIGFGKMQAESWIDEATPAPVDMREVAIYRSTDDGALWVRPREEFEDGRFEALATATEGKGE